MHPRRAGPCPRRPPSAGGVLDHSGVCARTGRCLTLGELPVVQGTRTAGGAIRAERPAEVSRGDSRPDAGEAREAPQGRTAGQQRGRAATWTS